MSAPLLMLKELGTIHTGSTPKTNDESLFGGDVPFVTPGDLDAVSPIQSTPRTLTEAGVKTADLLPAESVLVCCIGSLGKIGFAGIPVVTNQQINAVVFNPAKVHARYGFFACRMLKPQLELMAPATTVPIVNKSRFSELRIPVPPLEEQRRIAAILDQAETLRTQRRQALAHLDTLTQSLFLDMFGDPVANEKRVPVCELRALCTRITDGTHQSPDWVETGIPFLFISNIVDGAITFETHKFISEETYFELTKRCPIEIGDVLYTTVGSYGNAAVVTDAKRFAFQRHIAHIKPARSKTNSLFLAAMIQSVGVRRQVDKVAKGVAQKTVNLADLKGLTVFAPPLALQQTFATRIQAIEALKATHRTALAQLDALFASLQQRAFAGEL